MLMFLLKYLSINIIINIYLWLLIPGNTFIPPVGIIFSYYSCKQDKYINIFFFKLKNKFKSELKIKTREILLVK